MVVAVAVIVGALVLSWALPDPGVVIENSGEGTIASVRVLLLEETTRDVVGEAWTRGIPSGAERRVALDPTCDSIVGLEVTQGGTSYRYEIREYISPATPKVLHVRVRDGAILTVRVRGSWGVRYEGQQWSRVP